MKVVYCTAVFNESGKFCEWMLIIKGTPCVTWMMYEYCRLYISLYIRESSSWSQKRQIPNCIALRPLLVILPLNCDTLLLLILSLLSHDVSTACHRFFGEGKSNMSNCLWIFVMMHNKYHENHFLWMSRGGGLPLRSFCHGPF